MRLTAIKNVVTSKIGRQILVTQKHSPILLLGTGVVGMIGTVVLASRATLKMDEILKEAELDLKKVKQAEEIADSEKYTEDEKKRDKALVRIKLATKIAKLYAPAVLVGAASIGAMTGSHIILTRRNVGLTAAYAVVDKSFKEYRARVIDQIGPDKERELYAAMVDREIAVDTDEGVAVKTVRGIDASKSPGMYARIFDQANSRNWKASSTYNLTFLQAQQNFANDLLRARGHVFLNEVYDMLGFERTPEGQIVGWVRDNPRGNSDGYIDFGIFRGDIYMAQQFVNGDEASVWLDFNVDGVVHDLI